MATLIHLAPRLVMDKTVPLTNLCTFMACYMMTFTFLLDGGMWSCAHTLYFTPGLGITVTIV